MARKLLVLASLFFLLLSSAAQAAGAAANAEISAVSTNLKISFSSEGGSPTTRDGKYYNIDDVKTHVLEIQGLVEVGKDISGLAAAPSINFQSGIYRNVKAGQYALSFTYLNRGNSTQATRLTADVTDVDSPTGRWLVQTPANKILTEDQTGTFFVTLNVTAPYALDQVSLNVQASLVTATNVVSYNAFAGAIGEYAGGAQTNVAYGGINNIRNSYRLEAQNYQLQFITKNVLVESPLGYQSSGGALTDAVPGAKLQYVTQIKNNSTAVATDLSIKDKIPNNCHLYYNDNPVVQNALIGNSGSWSGGSAPVGPGSVVGWDGVYVSPNTTITVKYSVTID